MRHLIISRELPPASYAPGGIGTYVATIARLLAEAGETVHVIGEKWSGAPLDREESLDGRLIIHRIAAANVNTDPDKNSVRADMPGALTFSGQRFAWNAALLAEQLVAHEGIDVIEAQDWEGPLYYFLGRRALGLGPDRRPPCLVHLHTPTEFTYSLNGWTPYRPEHLATMQMEEFCIRAADALLSPSQYMAKAVANRFALSADDILVIPYPLGLPVALEQRDEVEVRECRIVYAGRLEPRKGLIEFIDAAVDVARSSDSISFDFIGEDVAYRTSLSVQQYMERRIPLAMRKRFRFHGVQPRSEIPVFLHTASAVVVPSRGENFPYACIEAMQAGVPVMASPRGGMVEMITDGTTGWIASSPTTGGFAEALRRIVETAPADRVAMGRAAAQAIRLQCGNERVVKQHLDARQVLLNRGATRSVGKSDGGGAVPAFAPIQYKPQVSIQGILRLPARVLVTRAFSAVMRPRQAFTWVRSFLKERTE